MVKTVNVSQPWKRRVFQEPLGQAPGPVRAASSASKQVPLWGSQTGAKGHPRTAGTLDHPSPPKADISRPSWGPPTSPLIQAGPKQIIIIIIRQTETLSLRTSRGR